MKIRFSVITFIPPGWQVGIVGERQEIGSWKVEKCLPLIPQEMPQKELIPSFWYRDIDIFNNYETHKIMHDSNDKYLTNNCKNINSSDNIVNNIDEADNAVLQENIKNFKFEYKFIKWKSNDIIQDYNSVNDTPYSPPPVCFLKENKDSDIVKKTNFSYIFTDEPSKKPSPPNIQELKTVIWEGEGAMYNRLFEFNEENVVEEEVEGKNKQIYIICPTRFIEVTEGNTFVSEESLTSRYYNEIKRNNDIHFNQIFKNIYIGSCPRHIKHINFLKNNLKVTCVFNFQTEEDIRNNYLNPKGEYLLNMKIRTADSVYELYKKLKILYVWMPTVDMNSKDREHIAPQAAFILHGLINAGHVVYVHCNAGVGRSVCAVSAYLCYVANFSIRKTHYIIQRKRPVAFFDETCIKLAHNDFKDKYILH